MNADMHERGGELFERFDFDLVHSHDWLVAGAAEPLARATACPWVVTVHATEFGRHQGWVDKYPQSHIHGVEAAMVHSADAVDRLLELHARPHRERVQGVAAGDHGDPERHRPARPRVVRGRPRGAAGEVRRAGTSGWCCWSAGWSTRRASTWRSTRWPARWSASGTSASSSPERAPPRPSSRSRPASSAWRSTASFLGWVGDDMLHSLYRISDVCIVPSIYEPFGLVALEAMASGCLTIVADTGGLREVVPGDGSVGLRFRSRDSDSLGEMLEDVLADDDARHRVVAAAREHVLKFDWAEVGATMLELYRGLVPARPVKSAR